MKNSFRWLAIIVALFMLTAPDPCPAIQNQKFALVIGNGAYHFGPLKNPVNDANDMASALKGLDFSVVLKTNADQRTMKEAIRGFGRRLRKGGVGLFYYAGHGLQITGRNYLIPIGAQIETESEVEYEAVDAGRILGQMEDAGNGLNIIILDACRNNPFGRSFRSSQRGLARMDAPEGTILAYATAPGEIAADGDSRNGLFTDKLLKHMKTPGLPIELFFKLVRKDVRRASGKQQVPWTESSLIGDFYFNPLKDEDIDDERKGIEQERLELARLKAEFEERQRLMAERIQLAAKQKNSESMKTPKYASVDPAGVSYKVVERGGRYEKYASGVVYDTRTGLEWYAGPDEDMSWSQARSWVASLNVAGGGWRLPTRQELGALYQIGAGNRNITPLLKTTGWHIWGVTKSSSSEWRFRLNPRHQHWDWGGRGSSHFARSFAVRSRK